MGRLILSKGRIAAEVDPGLFGVAEIVAWILWRSVQAFWRSSQSATEHRFMDEINPEARSVPAGGVGDVVAKLIFFLIAQNGKRRDGRNEQIVAVRFVSGNRAGGDGKRKGI